MDEEKKKSATVKKRTTRSKKVVKEEKKEVVKKTKKEERTYKCYEVLILMILTLAFGILFGRNVIGKKCDSKKYSSEETNEVTKVYNDIVNNYYGEVDRDELASAAICAMANVLNDQYSFCFDKESGDSFLEDLEGKFVGLGVTITDVGDNKVTVASVFDNSPAAKAGIVAGDILLKLDGNELLGENISSIASSIKSSSIGDKKVFTILRDNEEIELEVSLEEVNIPTVYSYIDEREHAKIGVIYITGFSSTTYDQFIKEYEKLKENNVNSLVIDVRNNSGGVLSSAVSIASMFLDKDMIVYQTSNGKETEKFPNENEKVIDLPVVIVVNEYTSSAAEVLAAALSENLNTPLVGTNTFGKGSMQKFSGLPAGTYVKYTVQEWLTPNGNKVNGIGLAPTYDVALPEGGNDAQLERAFEVIDEMVKNNE